MLTRMREKGRRAKREEELKKRSDKKDTKREKRE